MFIYKITCLETNKIYIGQTKKDNIEERFEQHKLAAKKKILNTHLCRAMQKYGVDKFKIEIIDTAANLKELTEKEYYWINYYNSTNPKVGYNETNNKNRSGGNTYLNKTVEEMDSIKAKISRANSGAQNGMSKPIKIKNIITGEILHFGSAFECARYFGKVGTSFIRKRCNGYQYLYEGKWLIAYEEADFIEAQKYDPSTRKGIKVKIQNLNNLEVKEFNSKNKASQYLNVEKQLIKNNIIIDNYKIIIN